MVSVTSDFTASPSFQASPPRPTRPDPSSANDSFGSLVDSNAAAASNGNSRAQDSAPSPRRNDTAPSTDKRQARDTNADASARDRSDSGDVASSQADTGKAATTDSSRRAKATGTTAKGDESKSATKPAGDDNTATTDSTDTQTADAVATAIQAAVVPVAAPVVVPGPTTAENAPLTIAAAAVAASSAVAETATALRGAGDTAGAKDAKAGAQDAADGTIAGQTAPANDPAVASDTLLKTAVTAHQAAPKSTTLKAASAATGNAATAAADPDVQTASTDAPAANAAPAAAADTPATGKPNVRNGSAEPVKMEPAGAHAPSAGISAHASVDAAPNQPIQTNAAQTAAFQPQLLASTTQAQPSLNVTTATPATAVPLSGLAVEIAASARSGKSSFEIRLDPADLGRIDVRIDVDRNGHVTSHLTVEKPETLSMLRQDAPQLQRALNDAGLSTGNGGLQFSLRDQSSSGQNNNQSNSNAQHLIITEDDAVPAAITGQYGRMFGASGGVDIRV